MSLTASQRDALREVFNILNDSDDLHVHISVYDEAAQNHGDPNISLCFDDLPKYLESPINFLAERWGVSIETYEKYIKNCREGWQCEHLTKKGKRCQKRLLWPPAISDFNVSGTVGCVTSHDDTAAAMPARSLR